MKAKELAALLMLEPEATVSLYIDQEGCCEATGVEHCYGYAGWKHPYTCKHIHLVSDCTRIEDDQVWECEDQNCHHRSTTKE